MNHPLIPIIALVIIIFVYGITKIMIRLRSNKVSDWKAFSISIAISSVILFLWWNSETTAQRWAVKKCENSKLKIYETALAQGFYEHAFGINTDLLRAILDGSFKYVETKVKRKYSNLSYGKYYISELSDQNCQNLHSKQITENVTKKRQYEHKNFPLLKVGQCIAVEYSDSLESKYEYYSNTKSTTGKGNRRVSIKLVREISSKKILAEWIGYSGSSVMSSSESCGYEDKNLPFKKVLL